MGDTKKIDKRDSLRVVTANDLVNAADLSDLSLNARKLLYVAVAQCRKNDSEFYEYEATPTELAEMWGVSRQDIYQTADSTTTELMKIVITIRTGTGFKKRHLFEKCDYEEDKMLRFQLHKDMSDLLLGLKKDFSKPLLWDFMRMRSPYSMTVWHLMQREMKSFRPMMASPIQFDLTLDELRKATGCEDKLKQVGEFKARVLDKAIKEIRKNCLVRIRYDNIRKGRTITGFRFTAESYWGTVNEADLSLRTRQHLRKHALMEKRRAGTITAEEIEELLDLTEELEQMNLEDLENKYPVE